MFMKKKIPSLYFFVEYNFKLFPWGSTSKITILFFSKMYYPWEQMSVGEIDKREKNPVEFELN